MNPDFTIANIIIPQENVPNRVEQKCLIRLPCRKSLLPSQVNPDAPIELKPEVLTSVIRDIITEQYVFLRNRLWGKIPVSSELLPGKVRFLLHRLLTQFKTPSGNGFPNWPIETRLDLLRQSVLKTPEMSKHWPDGKSYAVAITHDVDTIQGIKTMQPLVRLENELGVKSCWYIVGRNLKYGRTFLPEMINQGHEIGLHGFNHNLELLHMDAARFKSQMDQLTRFMDQYHIRGFRAPFAVATDRLRDSLKPLFLYTSQTPDTDRYSITATRRGCGTVFPFLNKSLLELPMTMPLDDRLILLGYSGDALLNVWRKKLDWIKKIGGMVMLTTHCESHLIGQPARLSLYKTFLGEILADKQAWLTIPGEIAKFWNQNNHEKIYG